MSTIEAAAALREGASKREWRILGQTALAFATCISYATSSHAFDLTGLWASDRVQCDKVFAMKGNRASIRKESDMYGSGFIIEGTRPNTRIGEMHRDAGSVSSRSLQLAWPARHEL